MKHPHYTTDDFFSDTFVQPQDRWTCRWCGADGGWQRDKRNPTFTADHSDLCASNRKFEQVCNAAVVRSVQD